MCIRDSDIAARFGIAPDGQTFYQQTGKKPRKTKKTAQQITAELIETCLLYTSDAADERSSVDLGGRRIIKKKKINRR